MLRADEFMNVSNCTSYILRNQQLFMRPAASRLPRKVRYPTLRAYVRTTGPHPSPQRQPGSAASPSLAPLFSAKQPVGASSDEPDAWRELFETKRAGCCRERGGWPAKNSAYQPHSFPMWRGAQPCHPTLRPLNRLFPGITPSHVRDNR
jgi:hypothetical protein